MFKSDIQTSYTMTNWKVDRLKRLQAEKFIGYSWNIKEIRLNFQHSPHCGPHTSSISFAVAEITWWRSFHSVGQNVSNSIYDVIQTVKQMPSQVFIFFYSGQKMTYRWRIVMYSASLKHSKHRIQAKQPFKPKEFGVWTLH